jgi:hypothetical protein
MLQSWMQIAGELEVLEGNAHSCDLIFANILLHFDFALGGPNQLHRMIKRHEPKDSILNAKH